MALSSPPPRQRPLRGLLQRCLFLRHGAPGERKLRMAQREPQATRTRPGGDLRYRLPGLRLHPPRNLGSRPRPAIGGGPEVPGQGHVALSRRIARVLRLGFNRWLSIRPCRCNDCGVSQYAIPASDRAVVTNDGENPASSHALTRGGARRVRYEQKQCFALRAATTA